MKEVLVLADEYHLALGSIAPDFDFGGLGQAEVKYMVAFDATEAQQSRQRNWKLVVDEECHDTCRTG